MLSLRLYGIEFCSCTSKLLCFLWKLKRISRFMSDSIIGIKFKLFLGIEFIDFMNFPIDIKFWVIWIWIIKAFSHQGIGAMFVKSNQCVKDQFSNYLRWPGKDSDCTIVLQIYHSSFCWIVHPKRSISCGMHINKWTLPFNPIQ